MPKKLKLDLNGLKVESFVTSLENDERKKIKGGVTWTEKVSCSCDGGCDLTRESCETCFSCPTLCDCTLVVVCTAGVTECTCDVKLCPTVTT